MSARIVTANGLRDGEVLYLACGGRWSRDLAEAEPAETEQAEAALMAIAERAVRCRDVVEAYAMAVTVEDGAPRPLSQRERIRAAGPTVGTDIATERGR
ncbi:MAG: DUF2849 domain-containing protein [Rhodospirillaceae bacterium]|jgi:hypothetical protein|nr:DUF2849 domain-containing protein [Rhodospirillaceae bacterium]MBT6118831.1 DUF2849 domain-containing protein [Rhodospirillaceae bacterium]